MLVLWHVRMSITSFSPELLSMVFSFLPRTTSDPFDSDFSALGNALLVCRLWRQVLTSDFIPNFLEFLHSHLLGQVGESPVLWRKAKLVVTSTEALAAFCEGNLPARFDLCKSLEITNSVVGRGSMFHMEDLPLPFQQLEERLSREDSGIENISIFPLKMVSLSAFFQKVNKATDIGECDLFPMVTSKIRMVRARTMHRETMLHITFLKELVHKMTMGQIKLRLLDLRGMEVALVGPNGRDTLREQLTRAGTKLLCDEENLIIEKNRTW